MYLTMFAVMLAAVVSHTDCHFSNSEQATKQMSIEFINPEPLHGINALAMPCIEPYDTHFCLNGGRCFNVTVASYSLPSCECAEGFMGERCEQKYLSRSYNLENYMKSDDNIQKKNQSHIENPRKNFHFNLLFGDTHARSNSVKVSFTAILLLPTMFTHFLS